EKSLNIYDANTSQLDKMTGDIRGRAHQGHITDSTDLYNIITDKAVSSFDQFQGSLAFSDADFAHDQDAFAIYVYQHSMNRNAGSKLHTQPADNFSHEGRGCVLGHQNRHIIFIGQIQHIFIRLCHRSKYYTWNLTGNKAFKGFQFFLSIQ